MKWLVALLFLSVGAAGAEAACPSPNPNNLAPPFVDDCSLPAAALNRLAPKDAPQMTGRPLVVGTATTAVTTQQAQFEVRTQNVTAPDIWNPFSTGFVEWDGVRSVLVVPSGTTATNSQAFGGYVRCDTAQSGGGNTGNCDGFYSFIVANANNSAIWGLNPNLVSTAGKTGVKMIGMEIDLSAANTTDTLQGIGLLGSSGSQPTYAAGFSVGELSVQAPGTAKWDIGFACVDGVVKIGAPCMSIGAAATTGTNIDSQNLRLGYRDAGGVAQNYTLRASGGTLQVIGSAAAPIVAVPKLTIQNINTSCSGQPTGTLWNNSGVVNICP